MNKVKELFLELICRNYPCGSQRCEMDDEQIEGCELYQTFKEKIDNICKEMLW